MGAIEGILAILLVAALGARYMAPEVKDRHNVFCLGLCTHVDEGQQPHQPDDPNEPAPEGQQQENDNE